MAETLCDTYLMFDVSNVFGRKNGAIFIGPGFEFWNNKFGAPNVTDYANSIGDNNQPVHAIMWYANSTSRSNASDVAGEVPERQGMCSHFPGRGLAPGPAFSGYFTMAPFEYRCTDCGRTFSRDEVRYLCPVCGPAYKPGIPLAGGAGGGVRLRRHPQAPSTAQRPGLEPVLPGGAAVPSARSRWATRPWPGWTGWARSWAWTRLWVKNDGLNPCGSLKDRASFLVAAEARRLGIDLIVAASTGNAASALAAVCASSGQQALIFVPQTAPKAKLVQMVLYGARVVPVKGTYDDAFRLSLDYTAQRGGLNRNTAYHPLTIEGKKTAGLEIWAQMGFQAPDAVVVSVGDGVILGGVHKGFLDLQAGRPHRPPAPADRRPGGDLRRHPPLRADRPLLGRRQPDHPRRFHLGHLPQQRPRRAPGHPGERRASPSPSPTKRSSSAQATLAARTGHLHRAGRRHRPGRAGQAPGRAPGACPRRPGW